MVNIRTSWINTANNPNMKHKLDMATLVNLLHEGAMPWFNI
jgi:hypothetical protein